jgi:RHH-type rel operon transcriptional repressor/antitoxin RelB
VQRFLTVLAIRLPEKIEERLERLAKSTGRTKAYCAKQAIIEHLEDLEDVEIADQRLDKLRTGKTRTVPLSRLVRKYGVDSGQPGTPSSRKPRNGSGKN